MLRNDQKRTEDVVKQFVAGFDERREQLEIRAAVAPEPRGGQVDRALEDRRAAVLERMRERECRLDPLHVQLEIAEERRQNGHRMDRRADVVSKSGKRQ